MRQFLPTPLQIDSPDLAVESPFRQRPPLGSVVISNYNSGRYLREAVRSVRAQTYRENECIIVDDCSTDNSAAVLAELERDHPDVKIARMSANGGQSRAVLEGLALARGDFVLFLDADDVLFPECISRHVALHLSSRRAAGFSCCNAVQMDGEGRAVGRWTNLSTSFLRLPVDPTLLSTAVPACFSWHGLQPSAIAPENVRYVPWSNTLWPWTSTSSMLYRRDALRLVCGAKGFAELRIGTDNFLAHFINHLTGSLLLDETLVGYRLHGANNFNKRPALEGFVCHDREDEHYHRTRRIMLDDLMLRFSHHAKNMEDPARIFRICRLLDGPDEEPGLPRWAARSRFSRLVHDRRCIWKQFIPTIEMLGLIAIQRVPLPWRLAHPRSKAADQAGLCTGS